MNRLRAGATLSEPRAPLQGSAIGAKFPGRDSGAAPPTPRPRRKSGTGRIQIHTLLLTHRLDMAKFQPISAAVLRRDRPAACTPEARHQIETHTFSRLPPAAPQTPGGTICVKLELAAGVGI